MSVPQIFDRTLLRHRRNRASKQFNQHDFLLRDVAERLLDRLSDITHRFPLALDLGCHTGQIAELIKGRGGIEQLIQCDLSPMMAIQAARNGYPTLVVDEDQALPFSNDSFDLVLSCLNLQTVNNLPQTFVEIKRILKPEGLFLAALMGGDSLHELRHVLTMAEVTMEGGASPHISPFVDIRDLGQLLQGAGFILPVVDADIIPIDYGDPLNLLRDLRGMGESSVLRNRRCIPLRKGTLQQALSLYRQHHISPEGEGNRIRATAHILYIIGWA